MFCFFIKTNAIFSFVQSFIMDLNKYNWTIINCLAHPCEFNVMHILLKLIKKKLLYRV